MKFGPSSHHKIRPILLFFWMPQTKLVPLGPTTANLVLEYQIMEGNRDRLLPNIVATLFVQQEVQEACSKMGKDGML
jgi:hypothetical protein